MASGSGEPRGAPKRTGRRAGPTVSGRAILEAAGEQFGRYGYEATTMRAVAKAAGVDTALIHHFFLTKEGLFQAAVRGVLEPPDLMDVVDGPRGRVGERVVLAFFSHWDQPVVRTPLTGLLRSVTTVDGAVDLVRDFLGDRVLVPVATALGRDDAELRAAMVGTQLLGLATCRYVLDVAPLAGLTPASLAAVTGRPVQNYLTGPMPG
jgi:AcrR family transcriptional regulator